MKLLTAEEARKAIAKDEKRQEIIDTAVAAINGRIKVRAATGERTALIGWHDEGPIIKLLSRDEHANLREHLKACGYDVTTDGLPHPIFRVAWRNDSPEE